MLYATISPLAKSLIAEKQNFLPFSNIKNETSVENSLFGLFVLTDGSLILLEDNDQFTQEGYKKVFISVDVNGYGRKPNRLGKDLFVFRLDNRGELLPMGVTGTYYHSTDDSYCSNTSSPGMNGSACTYKKLR